LPHHAELQRWANRFLSLVARKSVLYWSPNSRNLELQKISELFYLRFVWAQLLKKRKDWQLRVALPTRKTAYKRERILTKQSTCLTFKI
jgi:hypothetical protein